ncbi:hypothetical protein GQ53DRAFT_847377 [Thozetella sp. PMI_491]|nr:hypothetical protein GQ53DRAFT_847377 [Thozetella sp. PMI_491]
MFLAFLLLNCILPLLARGHVLHPRNSVGYMTLFNYARYCQNDGSSCQYTFGVEEDPDFCQFSPCVLTVNAKDGKPANQTSFQSLDCGGHMLFPYEVNGNWDSSGSMTLVITNLELHTVASVPFQDAEMKNGEVVVNRTQPSYRTSPRDDSSAAVIRRDQKEIADEEEWWQIQDMFRTWDTTFGLVDLTFNITQSNGSKHACEILLQDMTQPDKINSWSFYNQPCNRNDFVISWGYNDTGDFAVVTLCSPDRTRRAFFGYNHISHMVRLGDTGKSVVEKATC